MTQNTEDLLPGARQRSYRYVEIRKANPLFWNFQKSPDESVLVAEFNRRKKVIKDTCEKYGAFTTR